MKKPTLILCLFIYFNTLAQSKIDGLGLFKIGKCMSSKLPQYGDTSQGRLYSAVTDIPNTDMWYAAEYPIADMVITELSLYYYNDTLYKIQCHMEPQLHEALELKYGKGKLVYSDKKQIVCQNGYGAKFFKTEEHYNYDFPTASKIIEAQGALGIFYDDKCKELSYNWYTVTNLKMQQKVNLINKKSERDAKATELDKRKSF